MIVMLNVYSNRFISGPAAAMMVLLVWLHVLAAVSWIGGMMFLSLVSWPPWSGAVRPRLNSWRSFGLLRADSALWSGVQLPSC